MWFVGRFWVRYIVFYIERNDKHTHICLCVCSFLRKVKVECGCIEESYNIKSNNFLFIYKNHTFMFYAVFLALSFI